MKLVFIKTLLSLFFLSFFSGCTQAGTNVVSLLGSLGLFKLNTYEFRILDLSALSNVVVEASCTNLSTGFEIDISNPDSDLWTSIPAAFVTANDQCATSGSVEFTLDLSAQSPFSTMTDGQSYDVRFRDINAIGISTTETFRITYSSYVLASLKRTVGQGGNVTLTSGSYQLKGRLLEISDTASTSGDYTLRGKVIFE